MIPFLFRKNPHQRRLQSERYPYAPSGRSTHELQNRALRLLFLYRIGLLGIYYVVVTSGLSSGATYSNPIYWWAYCSKQPFGPANFWDQGTRGIMVRNYYSLTRDIYPVINRRTEYHCNRSGWLINRQRDQPLPRKNDEPSPIPARKLIK